MNFAIYIPPQANSGKKVPVLYWLSGTHVTHYQTQHIGKIENWYNISRGVANAIEMGEGAVSVIFGDLWAW